MQVSSLDIMKVVAQGHVPREVSQVKNQPLTLLYGQSGSAPLLYIHPAYVDEYYRLEAGPQAPSLLERLEFEHARLLGTAHLFPRLNGDDSSTFHISDPFGLALLKNSTIEIRGVVRPKMADDVRTKAQLIAAAMLKHGVTKPIKFQINSPGGCASSMASILDTMDMLKNTKINDQPIIVATYMDGMAASAASLILANGTKGHRFMNPKSRIMIHQPLGGVEGQTTDMVVDNEQLQRLKAYLVEFFKKTTNADEEWLKEVIERDYWMELDESIKRGFVDKPHTEFDLEDLRGLDMNLVFRASTPDEPRGCGGC